VCRIDANGIKGAWYETQLPFAGQHTLWVSDQQMMMMQEIWVHRSELPLSINDPRLTPVFQGKTRIIKVIGEDR
jgi:hypothetical protein